MCNKHYDMYVLLKFKFSFLAKTSHVGGIILRWDVIFWLTASWPVSVDFNAADFGEPSGCVDLFS